MSAEPVAYMERSRRYYAAQGFEKAYVWAQFDEAPFAKPNKPVSKSTLALITTASLKARQETDPRSVSSGLVDQPPKKLFADDLFWDRQATHLNDLNSFFPIDRLKELVAERKIGRLAKRFHSVPTEYSQRQTKTVDAPEILRRCREDAADLALLVPL